ncbi:MAG: hypothetical protein QM767_02335 [Anaeromyxobacter sp.]
MRAATAAGARGALLLATLLAPSVAVAGWGALVPDRAKLQVAGQLGLVAPGVGYAFARDRLETDLLVGWVPESIAGQDLYLFTGKLTWLPWRVHLGERWLLRPFTAAVALTYTLGGEGFWLRLPDRYERGYYELPTALRATFGLGATLSHRSRSGRELGLYAELVAGEIPLAYWISNSVVRAEDVFSLALGLRCSL